MISNSGKHSEQHEEPKKPTMDKTTPRTAKLSKKYDPDKLKDIAQKHLRYLQFQGNFEEDGKNSIFKRSPRNIKREDKRILFEKSLPAPETMTIDFFISHAWPPDENDEVCKAKHSSIISLCEDPSINPARKSGELLSNNKSILYF